MAEPSHTGDLRGRFAVPAAAVRIALAGMLSMPWGAPAAYKAGASNAGKVSASVPGQPGPTAAGKPVAAKAGQSGPATAGTGRSSGAGTAAKLRAKPAPAKPRPGFHFPPEAQLGWMVRDAGSDSILENQSGERNFTPGSIQKLFTTWIALESLGPERTWTTGLAHTGGMEGGALKGDLIIKGGGDPAFASQQFGSENGAAAIFAQWLAALQKLGVRRIDGCVIGDGSYLDEEGPHPAMLWEDAGNYYAGTVSGLCFNDNYYTLAFDGAPVNGKPVSIQSVSPAHSGVARFDNRLITGPAEGRDSAFILGGFPGGTRNLRGTYPSGRMPFYIKGSLPNPPWTCGREFRDYLISKGIAVPEASGHCGDSLALPNHAPVESAAVIASHVSPPLREIIRIVNQKSDNNDAAQTLALLGKGLGLRADWRGGLWAVNDWLEKHGFDRARIHLKDGNGLSRYNWIAPSETSHLLAYAFKQPLFPAFKASLVGSPGAEEKLQRYGPGWDGRLFVKTGTLEGVSSLAGYLHAASGRWLAFAISANNFDARGGDAQRWFIPLLRAWAAEY